VPSLRFCLSDVVAACYQVLTDPYDATVHAYEGGFDTEAFADDVHTQVENIDNTVTVQDGRADGADDGLEGVPYAQDGLRKRVSTNSSRRSGRAR
jgi:hypothetical protein